MTSGLVSSAAAWSFWQAVVLALIAAVAAFLAGRQKGPRGTRRRRDD